MIKNRFSGILIISVILFSMVLVSSSFSGSITYEYDKLNRIIKMEKQDEYLIEYRYDTAGNRTSVTTVIQSISYDHEPDGDVDGLDLLVFASGFEGLVQDLNNFANIFGTHN